MRSLLPGVALTIGLGSTALTVADTHRPARTFRTTESTGRGLLRVFATPGDFGIENPRAVAVVRQRDGQLVDFWQRGGGVATTAQLGATPPIDGLWAHALSVIVDGRNLELALVDIRRSDAFVEVEHSLELPSGAVTALTRFELAPNAPSLSLTTRLERRDAGAPVGVAVVDVLKWGNVDYFAAGHGKLPPAFEGVTEWVGRHGAGGDLRLAAATGSNFRLSVTSRHPGFRRPAVVTHPVVPVRAGAPAVVRRTLSYEPIPGSPEPIDLGRIVVDLTDERGQPLASKLSFSGSSNTPDPDFGNEGDETGANRFVWSGNGHFDRSLRPGRYSVMATAGLERAAHTFAVTIEANQETRHSASLARVIDTPGRIAADVHLHQAPSVDADVGFRTRVVSVAAEGIEFAVASDHYVVSDLSPTVRALARSGSLARPFLTVPGTEVSTTGNRFGHFNVFPMPITASVSAHATTAKRLLPALRQAAPEALIQVNHPLWNDIGYFEHFGIHAGSISPTAADAGDYETDFDALEVYNGLDAEDPAVLQRAFRAWLRQVEAGHRYTATGGSDSHKLFYLDPGLPRNLVRYGDASEDDDDLNAPIAAVIRALRRGASTVTSGPILDAVIDGARPGDTVVTDERTVTLAVRVRAAPWISVDWLEIHVGGSGRARRRIRVPTAQTVERYAGRLALRVRPPTFVVVRAGGGQPLPNTFATRARPLAFTNPIWVESEGKPAR